MGKERFLGDSVTFEELRGALGTVDQETSPGFELSPRQWKVIAQLVYERDYQEGSEFGLMGLCRNDRGMKTKEVEIFNVLARTPYQSVPKNEERRFADFARQIRTYLNEQKKEAV